MLATKQIQNTKLDLKLVSTFSCAGLQISSVLSTFISFSLRDQFGQHLIFTAFDMHRFTNLAKKHAPEEQRRSAGVMWRYKNYHRVDTGYYYRSRLLRLSYLVARAIIIGYSLSHLLTLCSMT